jgi:hypothetical protein
MAAQSKADVGGAPTAADANKKVNTKRQMNVLLLHCAINMSISMLNFSTRTEILLGLVGGDYNRVAWFMSRWTSVTAALEFIVNPTSEFPVLSLVYMSTSARPPGHCG